MFFPFSPLCTSNLLSATMYCLSLLQKPWAIEPELLSTAFSLYFRLISIKYIIELGINKCMWYILSTVTSCSLGAFHSIVNKVDLNKNKQIQFCLRASRVLYWATVVCGKIKLVVKKKKKVHFIFKSDVNWHLILS